LIGLIAVTAVTTLILCGLYTSEVKDLPRWQAMANAAGTRQQLLRSLVADLTEYSKQNPAILPLLTPMTEMVGAKAPKAGAPAATAPKPAGK
jgi:hypothetical protein